MNSTILAGAKASSCTCTYHDRTSLFKRSHSIFSLRIQNIKASLDLQKSYEGDPKKESQFLQPAIIHPFIKKVAVMGKKNYYDRT
jgi:hypothetical protein